MRTLGGVIMVAAAWALVVVGVVLAAGYPRFDRPLRAFLRSGEWTVNRAPFRLKFFDEHSAWTILLPLVLVLGVGWALRHYG